MSAWILWKHGKTVCLPVHGDNNRTKILICQGKIWAEGRRPGRTFIIIPEKPPAAAVPPENRFLKLTLNLGQELFQSSLECLQVFQGIVPLDGNAHKLASIPLDEGDLDTLLIIQTPLQSGNIRVCL